MIESRIAPVDMWLAEPLDTQVRCAIERLRRAEDVCRVAVMPDVHLAKDVCVGTVLATRRLLYPGAVGGDIGCGMLAMPFDASADVLAEPGRAAELLKRLCDAVPTVRRHRKRIVRYPDALARTALGHPMLNAGARAQGALQFGTLGGGNHFIEFQRDEDARLWLMVHSGSRAMGQIIRDFYTSAGRRSGSFIVLDADSDPGRAYARDVQWARQYADASRRAMAADAARAMKELFDVRADEPGTIACDHNHVALEAHGGESFWVHRKGAMPAAEGAAGLLPGSMGTMSCHVVGRGCARALESSAHGAGRAMSREAALRRFSGRELCRQMRGVWFDPRAVDHLRDEAPAAYKDLRAVLRAQHELVRVVRTLRPVLVYKGT